MAEAKLYLQHRRLCSKFYESGTRKHANGSELSGKLRALLQGLEREGQDEDKMELQSGQSRKVRDESPINERHSLRVTNNSSKNALNVSGVKSRRSDSSREKDKSEGESRFFNTEWVYSSTDQARVYVFAVLASFILTENAVGFFKLEDRMKEELETSQAIPPIHMISVNKYWHRVNQVVTKKKSYLWEKHLKEPLDRMPHDFLKLVARVVAKDELPGGEFSREQVGKLSREGRVAVSNFTIYCREIEHISREGSGSSQIIIGYLRHRNTYVIATKIPDYSEGQLKHRKVKAFLQQNVTSLLAEYQQDDQDLNLFQQSSIPNQKEKAVREFLSKKLGALRGS